MAIICEFDTPEEAVNQKTLVSKRRGSTRTWAMLMSYIALPVVLEDGSDM